MSEPTPLLAPLKPALAAARLWNGERFVADPWRAIADDEPLPLAGYAIVSLARWRADQAEITALGVPAAIKVQPTDILDPSTDNLARLRVIALVFPKFTDGRAYSTGRRLRGPWGYKGEIRATGDVLLDQLPLMLRAGFDAFEITHAATIRALEQSPLPAVSRVYQVGTESSSTVWQSRRRVAAGAD